MSFFKAIGKRLGLSPEENTEEIALTRPPVTLLSLPAVDVTETTQINISPESKHELGRMLAHYYRSGFEHPILGPFKSMEGFWYYVKTKNPDDRLRSFSGREAKIAGKQLLNCHRANFQDLIFSGNHAKIDQNEKLKALLIESTLPFDHWYTFGPEKVAIRPSIRDWLVADMETLRHMFQNGTPLPPIDFSEFSNKD